MNNRPSRRPLPVGWAARSLGDVVSRVTRRNDIKSRNVLTISARDGLVNQEEFFRRRIASTDLTPYFLLERGDFAYNKSYSDGFPVGVIRRLDRYSQGVVSPLYICFRNSAPCVNSDYLAHYFHSGLLDDDIAWIAKEGARNHGLLNVGVGDFLSVPIHVPPLAEQRKIAEILDAADEVMRRTERLIAKLEQTRQGLLRDLFTRGIGEAGRLGDPDSSASSFQESALDRIPSTWSVMSIGEGCSIVQDGTHLPPPRVSDGPLLLSVRNILGRELVLTDADTHIPWTFFNAMHRNWRIEQGDVCLAVVGATIGKLARVGKLPTFTIQRSLTILRGHRAVLDNEYLLEVLSTPELQRQIWDRVNQTAQPGIYLAQLRDLLLPVPPLSEQRHICERLSAIRARSDSALKEVAKLALLKRGLIDDLLTGRIRVGAST